MLAGAGHGRVVQAAARAPVQVAVGRSSGRTIWADLGSLPPEEVEVSGDPVRDLPRGGLARQADDFEGHQIRIRGR
jgi:hypothetical protein